MRYTIRRFVAADLPSLAAIYTAAVGQLAPDCYSPEQVAAWASHPDDPAVFEQWITGATTFVAVSEGAHPVGFGGVEPSGRISSLFVAPERMREGIGAALLGRLLAEIRSRHLPDATTQASEFSRPLFERFGFRVTALEDSRYKGVTFTRYAMHLRL